MMLESEANVEGSLGILNSLQVPFRLLAVQAFGRRCELIIDSCNLLDFGGVIFIVELLLELGCNRSVSLELGDELHWAWTGGVGGGHFLFLEAIPLLMIGKSFGEGIC
jgi:hypothetical protein